MKATIEQLSSIRIFSALQPDELAQLQIHTAVGHYLQGEMILQESSIRVSKTATTGKEMILRTLETG